MWDVRVWLGAAHNATKAAGVMLWKRLPEEGSSGTAEGTRIITSLRFFPAGTCSLICKSTASRCALCSRLPAYLNSRQTLLSDSNVEGGTALGVQHTNRWHVAAAQQLLELLHITAACICEQPTHAPRTCHQ